jgi:hypothetical protein
MSGGAYGDSGSGWNGTQQNNTTPFYNYVSGGGIQIPPNGSKGAISGPYTPMPMQHPPVGNPANSPLQPATPPQFAPQNPFGMNHPLFNLMQGGAKGGIANPIFQGGQMTPNNLLTNRQWVGSQGSSSL